MMNRRDFLKVSVLSFLSLCGLNQAHASVSAYNHWLTQISGSSFGFLAFGDMGTGWKPQYSLIEEMAKNSPQIYPAVILLGDLLYPSAKPELIEPNIIKPFLPLANKGFRFYPVLGNHDWLEKKAFYIKQYFDAPDYYTFAVGPAQFWILNSNEFEHTQANWLNTSLASSRAIWKIVCLHHSPYSSGVVHLSNTHLIKNLCPILNKYKIDLCLSGHNHLYERTGKINGVTYIVSGGGSASLHKFIEIANYPRAKIQSLHHYLKVKGDALVLSLEALDKEGKVFDQIVLKKY